jgi:hypothetical protein
MPQRQCMRGLADATVFAGHVATNLNWIRGGFGFAATTRNICGPFYRTIATEFAETMSTRIIVRDKTFALGWNVLADQIYGQ